MRVREFICHCGSNIAGTVDVAKVAEEARKTPGVAFATAYMYTCSEPGQKEITDAIEREKLDRVVVAACSPRMHEKHLSKDDHEGGAQPLFLRAGQHS